MKHDAFSIGLEFWCGGHRWRCTDVGTRVIIAIAVEPKEMVQVETDPTDISKLLTQRIVAQLSNAGLNVLQTQKLSCGDAGLALGQAWVAGQVIPMSFGTKIQGNMAVALV
ncbi:hypothetical protein [Rhodoferax antarcticus]|uniref:hypothetical protein n=1 Tax=Rhodoferax antarcticus TaxID=81479 RepID=UPI0022252884|nr:hypothetical protein [Rhodoferax antarcticus]MCW2314136.1 hypothetical protein [Rhodoferax antarcticus]